MIKFTVFLTVAATIVGLTVKDTNAAPASVNPGK